MHMSNSHFMIRAWTTTDICKTETRSVIDVLLCTQYSGNASMQDRRLRRVTICSNLVLQLGFWILRDQVSHLIVIKAIGLPRRRRQ